MWEKKSLSASQLSQALMTSRTGRDLNMEDDIFNNNFSGMTSESESLAYRSNRR